jgi:ppGpp synthetase/RelA/SpoT-type nucleotidyltranferase
MKEAEILARWRAEKPLYEAWSDFISQKVHEALHASIAPVSLDYFIKVPVKPRLKADSTLVDKALHRKKYANPYDDLTDKVGMRFVVLLTTDIKKICEVIEAGVGQGFWEASKDRDYERERLDKPLEFSYQSVHYVLRAKAGIQHQGLNIPEGAPCEVQIRTLLQHAHSELTHDTLYKPKTNAQPEIKRTVAKSMALIEATDEFFEKAIKDLNEAARPGCELLAFLAKLYQSGTKAHAGQELSNQIVIDTCFDLAPQAPYKEIGDFLQAKGFVFEKIKDRLSTRHFFSQPVVLLAYYLAHAKPSQLKEIWPLDNDDLALIFSDLGKKFEN